MNYEWKQKIFTPKDFDGAGQYIVKECKDKLNSSDITDTSYLTTVMMKIGWTQKLRDNKGPYSNVLVEMSDGLIHEGYFLGTVKENGSHENDHSKWVWVNFSAETSYESKQKFCEYLNNNPHKQTYRMATNEELIRVAAYSKRRTA